MWWSVATAIVLWGSRPTPTRGEALAEAPTAANLLALTAVALGAVILFVGSRQMRASHALERFGAELT